MTATDWTLTITALVTTCYTDSEDINTHITKMQGHCQDLVMMQHDIDDKLFACYLCISMPSTWNYVFAALPDHYTSAEVEWYIQDEYGIHSSQSATSSTFQASQSNKTKGGHSCTLIPGQPYCTNCKILGHHTKDLSEYWPLHGNLTRLIVVITFDILIFYLQINSPYLYPVIPLCLDLVHTHPSFVVT